MNETIIEILSYPRALMHQYIELEDCAHAGHYAAKEKECQRCDYEFECQWLFGNDECVALEQKSSEAVACSFESAIAYVEGMSILNGHDTHRCTCDNCTWTRDALLFIGELKCRQMR